MTNNAHKGESMTPEIKKLSVGLVVLALLAAWAAESRSKASLQGKNDDITASLVTLTSEVGKLRSENNGLRIRMEMVEVKVEALQMVASWYGPGFHGKITADGSTFDQYAFTCAHKTLPFGTVLVVEGANGHRVPVVVTDRGPFIKGRDIDLSYATAERVGLLQSGVGKMTVYRVML